MISPKKKILFAVLVWIAFFLSLEGVLTLAGVRAAADRTDPYQGFSRQFPLFDVGDDHPATVRTANNKLNWFNQFSFPLRKGPRTKRVFCVGGSTTYGRPWDDRTSFAGWLRSLLPLADPRHDWEVINLGGISYASYRVAAVMQESANFEPDLFIVYTGHNEFLENRTFADLHDQSVTQVSVTSALQKTRTFTAFQSLLNASADASSRAPSTRRSDGHASPRWTEVDERLNHTIGPTDYVRDDNMRERIHRDFADRLKQMKRIADRADAAIVFVTPAANESGCSPFKSEWTGKPTQAETSAIVEAMSASESSDRVQRLEAAVVAQPRFAKLSYELGLHYLHSGHDRKALRYFRKAIDEDVCPLRATTAIGEAVRKMATVPGVSVVDFERRLRQRSLRTRGTACLGDHDFVDHVHPNAEVHRELAMWILDSLADAEWFPTPTLDSDQIDSVTVDVLASLDRRDRAIAFRNLAKVWHWAGRFDEARVAARRCLEFLPRDSESRYLLADSLVQLGRPREAVEQYDLLFRMDPYRIEAFIPAGILYAKVGRWESARHYLREGLVVAPDDREAANVLAGLPSP